MRLPKTWVIGTLLLVAVAAPRPARAASILLNGDFENTSFVTTQFNLSNASFNAGMPNLFAFGGAQEIDVVTGVAFGIAPESGNWKVGLHRQVNGATDAFAFGLSSGIVAGQSYTLSFWLAGLDSASPLGEVVFGISGNSTSFGTQIFAATPPSISAWTQFTFGFIAPVAGSFLTVQVNNSDGYAFLDNVSLDTGATAVPEPATLTLMGLGLAAFARRRFVRRS